MKINLELPSGEQERLSTYSTKNIGVEVGSDTIPAEEEELNLPTVSRDVNLEPQNGLVFESKEEAYSFYREYAKSVGFGITIKASRRSKRSGKFIDVKIACSRFGTKRKDGASANPRSCPKTDCKASMHMKRREDGKWTIYSFTKEHNHEFSPADFYHSIQGWNKETVVERKGLQVALGGEDIRLLLEYFMQMQEENPNSLYSIDLDGEKRLRNVFWVSAKGRHDYASFGDAVFFDSFYVSNKYKIPFFPIVGVNNHLQFLLLGCALIGDESKSSFVWLMRTWLKAMGGQAPRVIISDQDECFKDVVEEVFPSARHCFCLWHVLGKIPDNLGSVTNQYEDFMGTFEKCVYQSWTDEIFEKRWKEMVDKFGLRQNEWMRSLFDDRKMWAPTYMRDTFLAGLSTKERSGSITCFLDKYVKRECSLEEFLMHYKLFLEDWCETETDADLEIRQPQPALKSVSPFEKQLLPVYTHAVFKEFQVEVSGISTCHLRKDIEDAEAAVFRIDDLDLNQSFLVAWNESRTDIFCSCLLFSYRGILCRHALLVLQSCDVASIPPRYILKRWTNCAKIKQSVDELPKGLRNRMQRFDDLCKRAIKLGEAGSLCRETYDFAIQALEEALKHCVDANNSVRGAMHGLLDDGDENCVKSVAKVSKKKKTTKRRKVPSELETITSPKQDSCRQMEQLNSIPHSFENCYVPQQDMQGVELSSRPGDLDTLYGAQQNMQGLLRLNSVSSIPVGYYSNQHDLQGLGQLGFRAPGMHGCFDIQGILQDMEQSISSASTEFENITSENLLDKDLSP